ncbi:XRE family transcriptional regulator [Micromonospora craterilacus]|uniref:XRE family transcriptional regulator n=1 Tax=Micromonospora craterilacus TaxID=1655439 RepID=A0A2W2ENJ6_9ACTN|nr:XRE family transcriptional regulator [Micromonospora craterilacus]
MGVTGAARPSVPAAAAVAAFEPHALGLARRWRRMRKNELARQVGVTAAAVSQYELGQARPSASVLARLALALSMPVEFFASGFPMPATPGHAHFRSLRATSQAERDQAEAFGEVAWRVVEVIGRRLRLPALRLPHLDLPDPTRPEDVRAAAVAAREAFGLAADPVPHVVRLLEAHGVIVLALPEVSERVDAFSHWYGQRPFVFLNPAKNDKARSRMDAAHELGHLLLHHDAEPGSQILEREATAFASEFLAPSTLLADELPPRLDFERLHELKRRWGISLKALVYRGHDLGIYRDHTYRRGMSLLAQWGYPEPGDLGPREQPSLLGKATELLDRQHTTTDSLAATAGLPPTLVHTVINAATEHQPELHLTLA